MKIWEFVKNKMNNTSQKNNKDKNNQELDDSHFDPKEKTQSEEVKALEEQITDRELEETPGQEETKEEVEQETEHQENEQDEISETSSDTNITEDLQETTNSQSSQKEEHQSEEVKALEEQTTDRELEETPGQEETKEEVEQETQGQNETPTEEETQKEQLQNLRDLLSKIKSIKEEQESKEEQEEINEENNFLESLKDLPSFKDRQRDDGYSIDINYNGTVPDNVIRMIINKFLNQRFLKRDSTLNTRAKSLEKSYGFYKWNCRDLVKHLETEQLTKIPLDKYDYKEESGKSESVPFSFYFDLSGSMSKFTGLLSVIAIELLKKDVKVLIGFNEKVNVQIDSIKGLDTISDLENLLIKFGDYYYGNDIPKDKSLKEHNVSFRIIRENVDNYLIKKKAEKCVIFSDFDPIKEVCNLSLYTEIYWFCFEEEFTIKDLNERYNGFLYKVQGLEDIVKGLLIINERKFKNLCYIDDPNILKKKIR